MIEDTALVRISEAERALVEARDLTTILEIRDKAKAFAVYARAKKAGEAANVAKEIQLRAERKAGEFLAEMDKATGTRGQLVGPSIIGPSMAEGPISESPTLAELGIGHTQSHRWQRVAEIPDDIFERHLAKMKADNAELTALAFYRIAKELRRETVRQDNAELVQSTEPIGGKVFQTVVIDPPWDWGDEGDVDQYGRARPIYATMPFDEISMLPVQDVTDENAHLYLWITNRSLPKGFILLERWGFRYITALTWCKPHFGMGNYFRGSTEHVLFGVKGSLPLLRQNIGTWFAADRPGRHSGKPEEFYRLVESCSPGPWLEMFARETRPGWASWGAEV